jgi:hypothetical protein
MKLLILTILTPLILALDFASPAHAQIAKSNSKMAIASVASDVETTLERTAIVALRMISQARSDVHRKKMSSAQLALAEAARLLETIEDNLSTATAKNLIQIARNHLEYEQAKQVLHDLPLINSSIETISFYLPTDKATLHIDNAKSCLEKNDKLGAGRELALANKALIDNEAELPLLKMQIYVDKARRYLTAKNYKKANEALQSADLQAAVLYTDLNSPLFHAKQSLWLSYRNYSSSHFDTGAQLTQAKNYLNEAALSERAEDKEEVTKLSSKLAELEKKLVNEGKIAESDLKAAWEKSKAISERSTAYLSAGLSESETTLGRDSNLIEARLHVMYARTYHLTTAEPDKAAMELDTAFSYLQKAAGDALTSPEDRKRMHYISDVLLALKSDVVMRDHTVRERYYNVEEELRDLKDKE